MIENAIAGPRMTIQKDPSTKRWGAHSKRISTVGNGLSHLVIHIQMDSKVTRSNLLKMGGTHSLELLKISKSIWHYLLSHGIIITEEDLPSKWKIPADWESRNSRDLYRQQTASKHISKYNQKFWISNSGTFCIKTMPSSLTIRSMGAWTKQHSNRCNAAFPPFSLISRIPKKGSLRKGRTNNTTYTNMAKQTWYPILLEILMQCPLLLTPLPYLLLDRQGSKHRLVQNRKLILAAWKVAGNPMR